MRLGRWGLTETQLTNGLIKGLDLAVIIRWIT